jgi:hypothetical protein
MFTPLSVFIRRGAGVTAALQASNTEEKLELLAQAPLDRLASKKRRGLPVLISTTKLQMMVQGSGSLLSSELQLASAHARVVGSPHFSGGTRAMLRSCRLVICIAAFPATSKGPP